jgi:hypothetical protein
MVYSEMGRLHTAGNPENTPLGGHLARLHRFKTAGIRSHLIETFQMVDRGWIQKATPYSFMPP